MAKNSLSQKALILEYIKERGSLIPAKISGQVFRGVMFGSETSKRCREMRKEGLLTSFKEGKFERYQIRHIAVDPVFQPILDNIAPLRTMFPVDQSIYKQ